MSSEEEKQLEMLNTLIIRFDHKFEREKKRQEKLAKGFLELVLNKARDRTNEELIEINYHSFSELHKHQLLYPEEFKEAMYIFEMNLMDIFNELRNAVINAFWKV